MNVDDLVGACDGRWKTTDGTRRRHPSPGVALVDPVYFLGGHTAFLWAAFAAKGQVDTGF